MLIYLFKCRHIVDSQPYHFWLKSDFTPRRKNVNRDFRQKIILKFKVIFYTYDEYTALADHHPDCGINTANVVDIRLYGIFVIGDNRDIFRRPSVSTRKTPSSLDLSPRLSILDQSPFQRCHLPVVTISRDEIPA